MKINNNEIYKQDPNVVNSCGAPTPDCPYSHATKKSMFLKQQKQKHKQQKNPDKYPMQRCQPAKCQKGDKLEAPK